MNKKRHSTLWLHFAGIVFVTAMLVFVLIASVWLMLFKFNVIEVGPQGRKIPILLLLFCSLLLGGAVAVYAGKVIVKPVQNMGKAFRAISEGDFSVKVPEDAKIDEIREISKQFNAMTHDLSHIETLRTDFAVNVSHEFKTPISSIEGYAALLQNPNLSTEKREYYTQKIIDNSHRLSNLVSNILLLAKLENQEMVIDNKLFRLDEQIRRTILLLEDKWAKKDITFEMDLPRTMYYGSERLIEHVWYNIVDNAIKHSPCGGVIEIRIETDEKSVRVEITDHGDGMSEEVIKHAFEKFYQGDSSRKEEGNGLGLALVKRVVNICGGEIEVNSKQGSGATFIITLLSESAAD